MRAAYLFSLSITFFGCGLFGPINGNTPQWLDGFSLNGNGIGGTGTVTVNVLASNGTNLIAGGNFTIAGQQIVKNVAEWNGTVWSSMGTELNTPVLSATDWNGSWIAGGTGFTMTGTPRTAIWNGTS